MTPTTLISLCLDVTVKDLFYNTSDGDANNVFRTPFLGERESSCHLGVNFSVVQMRIQ